MRRFLAALVIALGLGAPAAAQQDAIEGVIRSQIDAFLADDFAAAFAHASPGIRRLFGDAGRFGTMVREGYPMVWRPADVTFLELEPRGDGMVQTVLIRDREDALHVLAYRMIATPGGWRIDGVHILRNPGVSA